MDSNQDPDVFYENLRNQLEEGFSWPNIYLYKFIIPAENEKIAEINRIFDNMGAEIRTRRSTKGKYISLSIEVEMNSPEHVIEKYIEVGDKVKDVISL